MHLQPIYQHCPFVTQDGSAVDLESREKTSVGEDIFRRGLCLPSDNKMTAAQQEKIIEAVRACFE